MIYMGKDKFKNIDLNTIMKIAQTGNTPKKIGGHKQPDQEVNESILKWMENVKLSEGPVKVLSSDLYSHYQVWARMYDEPELNVRKFGRSISKLLRKTKTREGQMYFCNKDPNNESVANEEEIKEE